MSHFRSPHTPLWTVHCGCASNLWQMELTRLGSRSVTLNNDDEPEKPGPAGESVHAELLAAPLPRAQDAECAHLTSSPAVVSTCLPRPRMYRRKKLDLPDGVPQTKAQTLRVAVRNYIKLSTGRR